MIRKKKNGIEWLEFELFAQFPELIHGIFLRHGGVSQGDVASLNVSKKAGDSLEIVLENRRRIHELLPFQKMVFANQVHEEKIALVNAETESPTCDGMTTKNKYLGLAIQHADCQPAIFFDATNQAIACIHAGWRGQVKNIYQETVRKMQLEYGTKPENLFVGIGPSLGPLHSEFIHYKKELPERFYPYQYKPYFFDLWAIAKDQLKEVGVLPQHIQVAEMNTFSNDSDFFSYRRATKLGKKTGCHATIVGLI